MSVRPELEAAVDAVKADIATWLPASLDPYRAKDANGRHLLLDALTALAMLEASEAMAAAAAQLSTTSGLSQHPDS